ncbi:hypothetical protein [Ralstonia solanacearum]|uniref:hypothetical protein n=1 Tax=Ralstonia solanacearum TaxID=305 RepID=UPI000A410703|nr:hypothetical protein [Ralstonia solanacearum]MBB6586200.1 hypothetical protein [Ralstonia solanacearum]MCG3576352.1 hypothetical protein [Ralstonia solanacearum]MCL9827259.1 hypothetical protein [Ralstonia solanacearum]MCL9832051.1 hypothetical protein [Ralstonia solanacearum]MCL9836832.1 hypothetical protein [Ralstonia solanacearum]
MKNQTRKRSLLQWVGTAIDHVDKRTLPGHRRDRRGQRKKVGVDVFNDWNAPSEVMGCATSCSIPPLNPADIPSGQHRE